MTFEQTLDLYLRARCTLVVLVTPEEDRALALIKSVCDSLKRTCLTWDIAEGFLALTPGVAVPTARDPMAALEQIDKADGDGVFVLRDFHDCWGNAAVRRKLRSLSQRLKFTKKTILVTSPGSRVPEELKDEAVVVTLAPPGMAELEVVLERLTRTPGVRVNLSPQGREKFLQAGMKLREV